VQVTGFDPVHVPLWHVSDCVHALPSLHAVPFAAFGLVQAPVLGLQVPAVWHWSLALHVTGFDPVQVPLWQVSDCVHALLSLHAVPLAAFGLVQAPVLGLQVPAAWHWSLAVHVTGFDPAQLPFWQESLCVQALPSLHAVPLAAFGLEQAPVLGLQVPAAWHWSLATQVTGFAPVQMPLWQVSVCVQAFPSLHAVPFGAAGFEHWPDAGLHVPGTWHGSLAAQVTGFVPAQVPLWQVSV
jgi:hypothetical protein